MDKLRKLIQLGDEKVCKTDERHDLADRDLAALNQHSTHGVDSHHTDGGGDAREHGQQAPPRQYRILGRQQLADDAAHGLHFGGKSGITLYDRDVAEHVADAPVDTVVILFDSRLTGAGLARH